MKFFVKIMTKIIFFLVLEGDMKLFCVQEVGEVTKKISQKIKNPPFALWCKLWSLPRSAAHCVDTI